MATIPHYRLPLQLAANGDFVVVEEDSEEEVAQHARAVLATPLGHRELRPTLGLSDTTHQLAIEGVSAAKKAIEQALQTHEPRVEHHALAAGAEPHDWIDSVTVDIVGATTNG